MLAVGVSTVQENVDPSDGGDNSDHDVFKRPRVDAVAALPACGSDSAGCGTGTAELSE